MNTKLKILRALSMFVLMSGAGNISVWCRIPGADELLKKIDAAQTLGTDISAQVSFLQVRPVQGTNRYSMEYYRRDADDAFLLIMLAPRVEAGNGYLKTGDSFWMYRRNTRTFQHINRDENIGGTDVKSGDMESKKLSDQFKAKLDSDGKEIISETALGAQKTWKITLIAKVDNVTYPMQVMWVAQETYLVLKVENYSRSGTLMVTQLFPKYMPVQGKYIPSVFYSIDNFEKGNMTVTEISSVNLSKIPDHIFTKPYLESRSK